MLCNSLFRVLINKEKKCKQITWPLVKSKLGEEEKRFQWVLFKFEYSQHRLSVSESK